jgi:DNA-binding MarR family transcriptional regulator
VSLYLLTKNIQAHVKNHNADTLAKGVILHLISNKKTSASAIAKNMSLKLSAMMTRLQGLEKEGLIKRVEGKDHREYICCMTPAGKAFVTAIKNAIAKRCTQYKTQISDEELIITKRVIDALRKGLI